MADPAESYEKMSDAERTLFERDHYGLLPSADKFRIATFEFNSGQTVTGEKATIIDHAYGNGDGVLNQEDLKIMAEKREDKVFNDALAGAGEFLFETAAQATGLGAWAGAPTQGGSQAKTSGLLSEVFGDSAANDEKIGGFAHDVLEKILPRQIEDGSLRLSQLFGNKASGQDSAPAAPVVSGIENDEASEPKPLPSGASHNRLG